MKNITYLSIGKIYNLFLLKISQHLSQIFKRTIVWGYPAFISIEVSGICNLHCPECPTGNKSRERGGGLMELNLFKKIIDECKIYCIAIQLNFQGEPYLHPQINEMIAYAHCNKVHTSLSTNAQNISAEIALKTVLSGLDTIIISLDGFTQKSYEKYRIGGKIENVFSAFNHFKIARVNLNTHNPKIRLQFLVFKHNEHEIAISPNILKTHGADKIVFKTAQIYSPTDASQLLTQNPQFARYIKCSDGSIQLKKSISNRCSRLWSSLVITWNGQIAVCCFDKDADIIGPEFKDINHWLQPNNLNIKSIWQHKSLMNFREKVLTKRKSISICNNCGE